MEDELHTAAVGFGGPLASIFTRRELDPAFAFLLPEVAQQLPHLSHALSNHGESDRYLTQVVTDWLAQDDPGRRRLLVLEESLARYGDPVVDPQTPRYGNTVYHIATAGSTRDDVAEAFRRHYGYPGIGMLTRPRDGVVTLPELSDDAMAELADETVALLVRAWDDEAFLVVPVGGGLRPADLGI